ncbi:MAG TPA: DUF3108 domain-containing protein [Marinobacter hydrocarbonoclasticus]|jgi:hypothetical protein|uniref:DUF3108 domain-containing protein n=2 Tax=Marinobacteraceae TaxID=2887365 RepID=A0A3B8WDQ8_MARNT|nr:DUF3108 domain-containing protein [Marinobacter nauticus]|tara:strand:+ start:4614 stop:5294 length:681 start_codon:yes stop_codon:yes gene_type:complete
MIALPASAGDVDYAPLAPYEARYTASMSKGVSLNGEGVRELTDQGNNVWLYRTDVDSFIADINESLIFRWENGQVIPLRYRYHLSGFLIKDRKQSIDFDWQAGTATGSYRGEKFEVELRDKTLDPLGYQLQLHQDLKAGKRDVTYQVLDKGDYDDDRFAVIDEDSLGDNGRTMNTLKAEKVRDEDSKRQTLMWFDPARDYLLVRLLQVEPDGSEYELKLKDATLAD